MPVRTAVDAARTRCRAARAESSHEPPRGAASRRAFRGRMTGLDRLTGRPARVLGAGIVVLEFTAAVSTFVVQTLLPVVVPSLHATSGVGVLVSGSTLGLFVAMPLASYLL